MTAHEHLEQAIKGALRETIKTHGPVTPELIGSATKRIVGDVVGVMKIRNISLDTDTPIPT